ncbi:sensor histidine kinase [Streptomyces malaysiensis]|uniref:sensor histidine kinase n=1 Tax=Streptomyces malaysiensis TaxID=92644 RepID=UPI0036815B35
MPVRMESSTVVRRLRRVVRWWRSRGLVTRDRELALVLTALVFVPALSRISSTFGDLPARHGDAFAVLLSLGQTVPLVVRTRRPAVCLAVVGPSFAVHESLGYPPTFGSMGLYLALYGAGSQLSRHRHVVAALASAGYLAFAITLHTLDSPERLLDYLIFFLALAAFWLLGSYVRARRADEAERRRLAALAATAAERSRIARELHDVVTHHVTAMVVQADAAQFLTESPGRVTEGLTAISGTGRQALGELRHLLGVLEATGESAPTRRTPALGTIEELVARTRLGGQPVELIEQGERPPMAAGAELAAYRVVQESLTNAVKHAAGHATEVWVRYHRDGMDIDVTTDGPSRVAHAPDGRGLNGLRERVGLVGGELEAGARPGGGFSVSARIPAGSGS